MSHVGPLVAFLSTTVSFLLLQSEIVAVFLVEMAINEKQI